MSADAVDSQAAPGAQDGTTPTTIANGDAPAQEPPVSIPSEGNKFQDAVAAWRSTTCLTNIRATVDRPQISTLPP